jgi:thiazole/oxazole-forming peptide maturase SagD family component
VLGRSLLDGSQCFLPAAYCYLDYGGPWREADSTGCAAGAGLEDAALRGFLELVERDAFAIWWYNRLRRPAMDLGAIRSSGTRRLIELFEQFGRRVEILDITGDLQIPVMVAVSSQQGADVLIGSGASLDPEDAALRALLEAAILLCQTGSAASQISTPSALEIWRKTARLADHPYLVPRGRRRPRTVASTNEGEVKQCLAWCVERARNAGLEVFLIDVTRPETELPVARVVSPEMRRWSPSFAPGRLYDVPVKLGWRKTPVRRENLNPTPFFF